MKRTKKGLFKNLIFLPLVILIFAFLFALNAGEAKAQSVSISPASDNRVAGNEFYLRISGQDLDDFTGGQFYLSFDTDVLQFSRVAPGFGLTLNCTSYGIATSSWQDGTAYIYGERDPDNCAGLDIGSETAIFFVYFQALASGTTDIEFINDASSTISRVYDSSSTIAAVFASSTVSVAAADTEAPQITIIGSNPVNILAGRTYSDAGATSSDNVDGDITGSIETSSNVNTAIAGAYEVIYTVSDTAGNTASSTRVVNVLPSDTTLVESSSASSTIGLGDSYSLLVSASNMAALSLLEFDLAYDNNILSYSGFTLDADFDDPDWDLEVIDSGTSLSVSLLFFGFDEPSLATPEELFSLNFTATGAGDAVLTFANGYVEDFDFAEIECSNWPTSNVSVVDNSIIAVNASPAASTIGIGDSHSLLVSVSNMPALSLLEFDLDYDNNILSYSGFTLDADFDDPDWDLEVIDSGASLSVSLLFFGFDEPSLATPEELFSLNFTATGTGDAVLTFANGYAEDFDFVEIAAASWPSVSAQVIDDIAPVISLLGDNPQTIERAQTYQELGAAAADGVDGDISGQILADISGLNINATGTYQVIYTVSDSAGNPASAERTVIVVDTTAPAISNVSAGGQKPAGTTSFNLTFNTNENALCRLSSSPDTAFLDMALIISGSLASSHSYGFTGLANGQSYTYYIRCQDAEGNANSSDYTFSFSVANASSGGGGGGGWVAPPANDTADGYEPVSEANAERNGDEMIISWANPDDDGFEAVYIIRSNSPLYSSDTYESASSKGEQIYEGSDESYTDAGLSANDVYYYAIFSRYSGNKYSAPVIIQKFGQDLPVDGSDDICSYGSHTSLIGEPSAMVECVSGAEAYFLYHYGQNVVLDGATNKLYLLIAEQSPTDLSLSERQAIAFFIHHGTPTTRILGAGERAGVLNSYLSAFKKLPREIDELKDIIKIANGRWPGERREDVEKQAEENIFKNVYRRPADMSHPHDNAAVTVIAYGLRPADRNLESEKAAIRIFKAIYKKDPKSAADWDTVRAIAYSGAVR